MRRRRLLLLITLAACGSRECRLDPSPSCSYRPERGVSDAGTETFADEVVTVRAGDVHACVLLSTGDDVFGGEETRARCWGGNPNDQLARVASPGVGELWWYANWDDRGPFDVGAAHACVMDPESRGDGPELTCWGNNEGGQLGVDPDDTIEGVVRSSIGFSDALASMGLGGLHGCIAGSDAVICFGDARWGQLGEPDAECCGPRSVNGGGWDGADVVGFRLAAGTRHNCAIALEEDGVGPLRCWGHAGFGQVGPTPEPTEVSPAPYPVLPAVRAVAAGPHHTCVIDESRAVLCFGRNARGELGVGDESDRVEPTTVALGAEAAAIFAGGESGLDFGGDLDVVTPGAAHSCALDAEGRAYCWGDNSAGQLGLPAGPPELVPVAVHPDLRFASLALGGRFTCGATLDHRVLCWGANDLGQLGRTGEGSHEPTEVPIFTESFASP